MASSLEAQLAWNDELAATLRLAASTAVESDARQATLGPSEIFNAELHSVTQQAIDSETFKAVPEHAAGLTERSREDLQKCPFIRGMGAAGIELVEAMAANEHNPDRGPTMGELLAARKARLRPAAEKPAEKIQPSQTTSVKAARPAESISAEPILARTNNNRLDLVDAHYRHLAETLSDEPEPITTVKASPQTEVKIVAGLETADPPTTNIVKSRGDVIENPATISTPAPFIKTKAVMTSRTSIKKSSLPPAMSSSRPAVVSSKRPTQPNTQAAMRLEKPNQPPLSDTPPAAIIKPNEFIKLVIEKSDTPATPETSSERPPAFSALVEHEESALEEPTSVDSATSGSEFLPANQEITAYIDELPLAEAAIVQQVLTEIIGDIKKDAVLQVSTPDVKTTEPITIEVFREQLVEALQAANIDEKIIKQVLKCCTPAMITEIAKAQKLSAKQLNNLGTREYNLLPLSAALVQAISRLSSKLLANMHIGKYALSGSLV